MDADILAEAHRQIDRRGELPRPARLRLRDGLIGIGVRLAWGELEAAAARHVRHHWDARFRGNDEPWVLLDDALAAHRSETTLADGKRRLDGCWALLLDLHRGPDFRPTYAGFAAHAAAWVCAGGARSAEGASELDIDVEDWDACFFASLAACGGAVWEPDETSDDALRRAFWEWYLDAAAQLARTG